MQKWGQARLPISYAKFKQPRQFWRDYQRGGNSVKSKNTSYLPAIDHLRAFAATLVILHHGTAYLGRWILRSTEPVADHWLRARNPFEAVLFEGHTGVALFIVLSGFIFTSASLGHELPYWRFIRNRALRIYPLFLLLIFVGVAAHPETFDFTKFAQTILGIGNVNGIQLYDFSSVFWTIAVELQFYLIFPFLLSILNREGVAPLIGIIAVAIIMRWCAYLFGANIREVSYGTIVGRIDQFLFGAFIAVIYRRGFRPGIAWDASFLVAVILGALGLYAFNRNGGWPTVAAWKILLPTTEGAIWSALILGYLSVSRFIPEALSRVFAAVGTISYSLYLLHMIVVQWFIKIHPAGPPNLAAGTHSHTYALFLTVVYVFPVTIALSALTYYAIERPFLAMRSTYRENISPSAEAVQW
jgi:peptidoglycan/LPS O-acetylase OafA/YrhL